MKIVQLTREQLIQFAVKKKMETPLKYLKSYDYLIDGSTIEDFKQEARFMDGFIEVFCMDDRVIFADKKDVMSLYSQTNINKIEILTSIKYQKKIENSQSLAVLGEYQKYFDPDRYVSMIDITREDYMDYFFESVCEPVLEAINKEGVKVTDYTYVALIDFVLENIKPDRKVVLEIEQFLEGF